MHHLNAEEENSGIQVLGRLVMMGVLSTLLCFSLFMTIFTPYPVGLSSVLYGRVRGMITALVGVVTCFIALQAFGQDFSVFFFFIVSMLIALGLGEIVHREINPIKGILAMGSIITFVVSGVIYLGTISTEKTIKEQLIVEFEKVQPLFEQQKKQIEASGESQPFEIEALFGQPSLLADKVIENAPSYFLMSLFITLWINLFLLLKSDRLVKRMNNSKYGEQYLLNFKMPEQTVWIVIVLLALSMWGDQVGPWVSVVSLTCLKTLGVFYFFQGFGIYLAFLDFLKITGFIRSFLVVLTVFTAGQILAVVGLADMFINFKKLMVRKED